MGQNQTLEQINKLRKTNPIYDDFIDSVSYIGPLEPTKALDKEDQIVDSKNSLSLKPEGDDDPCTTLIKRFGIKDETLFKEKYKDAISGDGNEERRILTLHSSSLCALLHFYNPQGLLIPLEGNYLLGATLHVLGSTFEFKNKVFNKPSNIDIVLYGYLEETKEKCLLFLESKYSEYLKTSLTTFSDKYEKYYANYFGSLFNIKCLHQGESLYLTSEDGRPHYYEGIKQMTSHLVGITNFMNGIKELTQDIHKIPDEYLNDLNTKVYFGEICYEHQGNKLDQWRKDYNCLAAVYNNFQKKEEAKGKRYPQMVDGFLTYKDIFSYEDSLEHSLGLEPEICFFYKHLCLTDNVGLFAVVNKTFNYLNEYLDELDSIKPVASTSLSKDEFLISLKKAYKDKLDLNDLKIGRVEYDFNKHISNVYLDEGLINNQRIKNRIINCFRLNKEKTVFIALESKE